MMTDPLKQTPIDNRCSIAADGKSITCLRCGKTSYNFNDVKYRYCAHCKRFHDDPV
jgi:hypothetical protein